MVNVIVIGGNHHNTLSVLRSLGSASVIPHLILITDDKDPYVRNSKYIDRYRCIEKVDCLTSCLLDEFASAGENNIIIACSDAIASHIDDNRNILSKYFKMPGCSGQISLSGLMNKQTMAQLALDSGFIIPYSLCTSVDSINHELIDSLPFPCIVKPLSSVSGSKEDIEVYNSTDSFKKQFKTTVSKEIQIQSFIEKEFEYQLIGCSLDNGEILIIPGASIILRQPKNTNTGFLKYVPSSQFPVPMDACKKFMRKAQYSGLFSIELLRGKDGKDYFMECNFRNDGNAICVTAAGMNLPYIWYLYYSGKDIRQYIDQCNVKEVYIMPEFNDFRNVISRRISIFQWLKDVVRTDCFMEFSFMDQKPFWAYLRTKIKHYFSKIVNAK